MNGLPKLHNPHHHICSSCAQGKQHQASFPEEASHRATHILELVHVELAGPMEVASLGGSRYYMLLIRSLMHFLISSWLAQVENQARCKVSFLRADNGGEFTVFEDYLSTKGIQRQTTIFYTSQ